MQRSRAFDPKVSKIYVTDFHGIKNKLYKF